MGQRMNVGVIGATGMVGQNYLRLVANHPWFEVRYVAVSPQSVGKTYAQAVAGRWHMSTDIPGPVQDLVVGDASDVQAAKGKCDLILSAVSLDKKAVMALELAYATAGPMISSSLKQHSPLHPPNQEAMAVKPWKDAQRLSSEAWRRRTQPTEVSPRSNRDHDYQAVGLH